MIYPWIAISETSIPRAANPLFQHLLDTYVSESNKVASTWKQFNDADLEYKPHGRSSSITMPKAMCGSRSPRTMSTTCRSAA